MDGKYTCSSTASASADDAQITISQLGALYIIVAAFVGAGLLIQASKRLFPATFEWARGKEKSEDEDTEEKEKANSVDASPGEEETGGSATMSLSMRDLAPLDHNLLQSPGVFRQADPISIMGSIPPLHEQITKMKNDLEQKLELNHQLISAKLDSLKQDKPRMCQG